VLGIGINVQPAAYPPEVARRATSIESELGRSVDRGLVLAECLAALSTRYRALHHGGARDIVEAWRRRAAATLGRRVEWDAAGERRAGLAETIDEDGALLVKSGSDRVRILSGEVRWL
jgi:BirA family biotin operon repressor/biotin-[acetyl-CoA-carboxylase] ligase